MVLILTCSAWEMVPVNCWEKVCFAFGGKGRKIAYPAPSFSMYETYITLSDSTPVPYRLDEEFKGRCRCGHQFCKKEKPDVLIVNNPNNPTGNL